jgi:hypothetical protein
MGEFRVLAMVQLESLARGMQAGFLQLRLCSISTARGVILGGVWG